MPHQFCCDVHCFTDLEVTVYYSTIDWNLSHLTSCLADRVNNAVCPRSQLYVVHAFVRVLPCMHICIYMCDWDTPCT